MKTINILAIAPYEGMAETLSMLAKEREGICITIRTGNLLEGLEAARTLIARNEYDIIISRGGTAELLRKELNLLVIDVPLSVYDILRSIKMAENYAGKYAIAGFPGITNNAHILCDLLQLELDIFTFQNEEDVLPILQQLKARSYSLVICDMIGSLTAQTIGLNSIFIPSGSESLNTAIDDAVTIVNSSLNIHKQREILKSALTNDNESVLIFDPYNNIWFSNLTNSQSDARLSDMIQSSFSSFSKSKQQSFERQLDDCICHITKQSIHYEDENYTLLRITRKKMLFEENDKTISIYNDYEETFSHPNTAFNSSVFVGSVHTLVDKYAPSSFPVLITGEIGTGKEKAAALLYKYGPFHNRPYYVIDCNLLSERKWNTLLKNENSPLNNINTTIHMKDVGKLSNSELSKLYTYIEDTNLAKRNRLIFSLITPDTNAENIKNYLTNRLSCLLLPIESLRNRSEDISSIATLYINQMNSLLGKQIVGLDAEAFKLIKNFHWPNNLDQFHRVLRELTVLTDTSYITADTVDMVLKQENEIPKFTQPHSASPQLDLTQTLDKITCDIVRIVLSEENMNKEKTAKRLGISRSTLWRMLKNHK